MSQTEQIKNYLNKRYSLPAKGVRLNDSTPLLEGKVIDSIGMLELISFIETTFDVSIPDEDISPDHFATVAAIQSYLQQA